MSILRAARDEVAGAARSLRYDLTMARRALPGPDSTDRLAPRDRRTSRVPAAAGVGALVLAGAAGTYFAVLTGLGGLGALAGNALAGNAPVAAPVAQDGTAGDGGHFAAAEPAEHVAARPAPGQSAPMASPSPAGPVVVLVPPAGRPHRPESAGGARAAGRTGERIPVPAPSCVCQFPPEPEQSTPAPTATAAPSATAEPVSSGVPTVTPSATPAESGYPTRTN